ncbi:BRD4-interacting chromatin-remodeling complex-associated protein isoform X2 [Brachyhypopomus gauderio]|uniref:BRD4-interacting chromatin-remodeling complex-associated protein isoform X2 n=1 Tax=Brachyhypopomus gauderio TaxID=698409 RepID=UPI004041F296
MEDDEGTCLLDVLCDPQALNDFLHGTKELLNGDLLINSSSGEPSLFTDTPSPVSLLADDAGSHDTPTSGCVDLSFLDEALLASPAEGEDSEEVHEAPEDQEGAPHQGAEEEEEEEEEEETCDILQQSLQEADITEHTLALEAGLAQTGDALSLYPPSLALPSPTYLHKPLGVSGVAALPRDTQVAVEPPQPSLLAVGPGCPSLKPAAPQLMGLLPGNVFPAPPPETAYSTSPAHGSSMIVGKSLAGLAGRPLLAPGVRATVAPEIILQRTPLPIQPKLPVNIQPRLVQISPKPAGQKTSPGLAFIPPAGSQNILLSSPVAGKQPAASTPTAALGKPVSLQLLNQSGSIVIQPQSLFPGQSHFILPSQSPVTVAQSGSTARPLLSTASNQMPAATAPPGHLIDGSQIVTVRPRQLNFGPVFATPSGQLTLRQGALLSGPLQLQSAAPTVFQMPAQLTGACPPGQHGAVVHSPALGNHITLINGPGVLAPDVASISIVNGPSVVQSLPFVSQGPQGQRAMVGGPAEQLSLPQTPVLLLPERTAADKDDVSEQLHSLLQESRPSPPGAAQTDVSEIPPHASPVITLLQTPSDSVPALEPVASVDKHLIGHPEKQRASERGVIPQVQTFLHHTTQEAFRPPAALELLTETLLVHLDGHVSPAAAEGGASPMALAVCAQADALSVLSECGGMPTPAHSGSEHSDTLCSPPIPQCSGSTPSALFPTPPLSDRQTGALSVGLAFSAPQGQEESVLCTSPSSAPEQLAVSEQPPLSTPTSTGLSGSLQASLSGASLHILQSNLRAAVMADGERVSPHLQDVCETVSLQDTEMQTAVHMKAPASSVRVKVTEKLTPAMRQHRVMQQLCSDHDAVLRPNTRSRFVSLEDAVRHLLPYHTFSRACPSQDDLTSVDRQFESASGLLLKRATDMLNKHRQLLLAESQRSPSAEMVMLERLFLQSERLLLGEERRRARGDPESFLMSLRKASIHHSTVPVRDSEAAGGPPSPPAWALHSDRPPGLKTYRSRSRGALRLTIKHESGSRKVVHNSACDDPHASSGHGRPPGGQLSNGGDARDTRDAGESLADPLLGVPETDRQRAAGSPRADSGPGRTAGTSQAPSPGDPSPERRPPQAKRIKRAGCPTASSPQAEGSGLSEHLQSAIDSILELQRLQGPAARVKPKLEQPGRLTARQAVNCILEGEL